MKHYLNQALLVLLILVSAAQVSIVAVWGIFVLSQNVSMDNGSPIYVGDWSILVKMVAVGDVLGTVLVVTLMKYYGRRKAFGAVIIPGVVGWLLIAFGNSIETAAIGLLHINISSSTTNSLMPIIIGEYSSPKIRGVFLILNYVVIGIVLLVLEVLAMFFPYYTTANLAVTAGSLVSIGLITVYFLPESPVWLASKKRYDESEIAFRSLRADTEDSRKELEQMIKIHKALNSKPKAKMNKCKKIVKYVMKLATPDFWKPFGIMLIATVLVEVTYYQGALQYLLPVMVDLLPREDKEWASAVPRISSLILVLTAIVSIVCVRILKRRTFLFCTGVPAFATLGIVTACLALAPTEVIARHWEWPMSLMFIFIALCSLCCAPLVMLLLGEVFPLAYKGVGSAATKISMYTVRYLIKNLSLAVVYVHIASVTLAIFMLIIGVCLLLLYYLLPETRNKPLVEIEKYFRTRHFAFSTKGLQDHRPQYHELSVIS